MTEEQKKSWKVSLDFAKGCDIGEALGRVADALAKMDAQLDAVPGLKPQGAADLRLISDEIGSNVVRHASPEQATRLMLELETREGLVRLRISDNGRAFNPLEQPSPYLGGDLEKRGVGGLGLYFIRKLFPHGNYRREGEYNVTEVEYRAAGAINAKAQKKTR